MDKYILINEFNSQIYIEYLFKGEVSDKTSSSIEDENKEEVIEQKRNILCAEYSQSLTDDSERIEVNGAHKHTFVNPAGIMFQIGCFANVSGVNVSGEATEQWSWFKGYIWKIMCCDRCGSHLGWVYLSEGEISFFGLILSRLSRLN